MSTLMATGAAEMMIAANSTLYLPSAYAPRTPYPYPMNGISREHLFNTELILQD